jgi:hypothetical protein
VETAAKESFREGKTELERVERRLRRLAHQKVHGCFHRSV